MSFNICGFVKDNLTSKGIENVWITIMSPTGDFYQVCTDTNGKYEFYNLEDKGIYIIYENVKYSDMFPPTEFPQPIGYAESTSMRVISVNCCGENIPIKSNFEHKSIVLQVSDYNPHINITKKSTVSCAAINDIISYNVTCINDGDADLDNVVVSELIPLETAYIPNSLFLNGLRIDDKNILSYIHVGSLKLGEECNLEFKVKMISSGSINSFSTVSYTYKLSNSTNQQDWYDRSNNHIIDVYNTEIVFEKYADKEIVLLGECIEYSINIFNNSDVDIYNVLFTDNLKDFINFIPNTLKIDETIMYNMNVSQGISIPYIKKGNSVNIKYKISVISSSFNNKLTTISNIKYSYILPNGSYGKSELTLDKSCSSSVNIAISNFKQINIQDYLRIPTHKTSINEINSASGDIKILKYHTIQTMSNTSIEGQRNTGHKLIVHGLLNVVISYSSCDEYESIHSAKFDIPFSSFIVLPLGYTMSSKVDVDGKVEHISYKIIDNKTFFINAMTLLNVKTLNL